jgi:electron transport complex protein RnfC
MDGNAPSWPREAPDFIAVPGNLPPRSTPLKVDRHNSPDLSAQLQQAGRQPIDTVLCSALDDDPALRLNAAVAARQADGVVKGVQTLMQRTAAARAWIVVEAGAPADWTKLLRKAAREANIAIVEVPNHYPQADPTLLIYTLTNRRLKPGKLPTEQRVLLLDAPAAAAIGKSEASTQPVGLCDQETGKSVYLEVPLGMSLQSALDAAGISGAERTIHAGDWRRKRRVSSAMLLDGGELTFHLLSRGAKSPTQPCIRCGWCMEVCPTGVSPARALEAAQRGDAKFARSAGIDACIECGLCDLVCPSYLPLLAGVRRGRELVVQHGE